MNLSIRNLFASKSAAPLLLTAIFFAIILYLTQFYWSTDDLHLFIAQFGMVSMVVYVVIVLLANVAAPISASPLLLLGFSLYGQNAIWLFALGNIAAMAVNFWIARTFGRTLLLRFAGPTAIAKIDELAKDYGLFALFIVRVFLSGISDLASYAFGLSPIKFKPYMIISVIGSLPPYVLLYIISDQNQTSVQFLLLQLLIAGVLSVLYLVGRWVSTWFMRLLLKGEV